MFHPARRRATQSSTPRRHLAALLAALLAATLPLAAVHADDNVTLYGLLDGGIRHDSLGNGQKGSTGAQTSLLSGNLSNSYYGITGHEDLGNGAFASFDLQGGLQLNTGTSQQQSALFDRRAVISLSSPTWGAVSLGRNTTFAYDQIAAGVFDPLQRAYNNTNEPAIAFGNSKTGNIGSLVAARLNAANTVVSSAFATDRNDNMLKYQRNDGPITLGVSYEFGGAAGHGNPDAVGALVKYNGDRFALAATLQNNTDLNDHSARLASIGGNYTLGTVTLQAAFQQLRVDDNYAANVTTPLEVVDTTGIVGLANAKGAAGQVDTLRVSDIGFNYATSARWTLVPVLFHTQLSGSAITNGGNTTAILMAKYQLSKRDTYYVGLDDSRSSGSLHGTNTTGRDWGFTTGLQLKF